MKERDGVVEILKDIPRKVIKGTFYKNFRIDE